MCIRDRLKQYIKSIAMGFNYDKYWNRRDKIFGSKTPSIIKAYYKFYLRRVDAVSYTHLDVYKRQL